MNYNKQYIITIEHNCMLLSSSFVEETKLKEFARNDGSIFTQKLLDSLQQRNILKRSKMKNKIKASCLREALFTLNGLYLENKINYSLSRALFLFTNSKIPLTVEKINTLLYSQLSETIYILLLLIDFLDVDIKLLFQNKEWIDYMFKMYDTFHLISDKFKSTFSYLIDYITLLMNEYLLSIISLGSLLLQERRKYNISPKRNILTRDPNDNTGMVHLHNVLYSLRIEV